VPKRDERQIKLDPLEWRDAMRDRKPDSGKEAKAKPVAKAKPGKKKG
jgi:hypothetical protein